MARKPKTLQPGTKLGNFEVAELIGVGGMGEVYRATDTKLGRAVAIKVLPREFSNDTGRLERFEREARVLASTNHSNIAVLHGLESHGDTTASDLLADTLKGEIDWSVLPDDIPPRVQILLRRCLEKNPQNRLHHIADARIELSDALAGSSGMVQASGSLPAGRSASGARQALMMLIGLVVGALGWMMADSFLTRTEPRPIRTFRFSPPPGARIPMVGGGSVVAISPDGSMIAFVAELEEGRQLYVRWMDELDPEPLAGTRWSRDPEKPELFYRSGNRMMALSIETEPELVTGPTTELFEIDHWAGPAYYSSYDLLPDGRFVLVVEGEDGEQEPREFVVVVNWAEKLRSVGK